MKEFLKEWQSDEPCLLVHTSGSTGEPKPMMVEKARMRHSARITCQYLGLKQGDTALLCMPLRYIAGKMMVVRALEWGLRLVATEPSSHPLRDISESIDFAAMVPLQVKASLEVPEERERLMQVRYLLIGGGAIDEALEAELRTFPHAVWSSYGMTETLSHIALRRVSGPMASQWYQPLPGIAVTLSERGTLVISAPHLCADTLVTNDLAQLNDEGAFRILGRVDNIVCSGGIKLRIEEIEEALQPMLGDAVQLTAQPDERYGESLVMLSSLQEPISIDMLRKYAVFEEHPYWLPKRTVRVAHLPRTETGKPDRAVARRIAALPEVHYAVRDNLNLTDEALQRLVDSFPQQRRDKVMAYRHHAQRCQSALAYDLLRNLLRERFGITEMGDFVYLEHGKPYLAAYPWVHFSMSHCREAVAVAVSEREVGIDVERIATFKEQVGRYVLSDEEYQSVVEAEDCDRAFTRLWTKKEAFLKMTGEGVGSKMHHVLENLGATSITTIDRGRYVISVAE